MLDVKENVPLAPLTTFKIGGPAKYFTEPATKEELLEALAWAGEKGEKVYIFGGGSNLLVNDEGVNGLVLKPGNNKAEVHGVRLECGAGASLAKAALAAKSQVLTGLEWSSGIPNATIGGAVRGNAGAFGTCMADLVETVECFDFSKRTFATLSTNMCRFGYRHSLFKEDDSLLVWQATLKMEKGESREIENLVAQNLAYRSSRHARLPSAGSIFKNVPLESVSKHRDEVTRELAERGIAVREKIGAGLLIDLAGLKGKAIGGAKISLEHANQIVNTGKATAGDVAALISVVKQKIRTWYGLELQEEIVYFGYN